MNKKNVRILIAFVALFLITIYFWKAFLPNQLEYRIEEYFDGFSYYNDTTYKIHDSKKWLNGELVVVEGDEMIGVVYLEKVLGIYNVKNHALCNKNNEVKSRFMGELEYQYRLLRVKSFVDNKDVLLAYIKDDEINSFRMEIGSNEVRFELPGNKKVVLSEVDRLYSTIKTHSEVEFIEWKDEKLQDMIKYNSYYFVCQSDNLLNIAVVGGFEFKTGNNIVIENIELDDIPDLSSEEYDAVFINSSISDKVVDDLIKKNWAVYIIDPLNNLETSGRSNVNDNVIIKWEGNKGSGSVSKSDFYDLKTDYYLGYSFIFDLLSKRKEK